MIKFSFSKNAGILALVGALAVTAPLFAFVLYQHKKSNSIQTIKAKESDHSEGKRSTNKKRILILYSTTTGTSKKLSENFYGKLTKSRKKLPRYYDVSLKNIADFNEEKLHEEDIVLLVLSTWSDGQAVASATRFIEWLRDVAYDFRWDKNHLSAIQYSIFGLGGAVYGDLFCKTALETNQLLEKLGGKLIAPVMLGDDASNLEKKFQKWCQSIEAWLLDNISEYDEIESQNMTSSKANDNSSAANGCDCGSNHDSCCNNNKSKLDDQQILETTTDEEEEEDRINFMYIENEDENMTQSRHFQGLRDDEPIDGSVIDVEDLGNSNSTDIKKSLQREMVTKLQRKALTKEGYKIIGSHSAVKLCRWTKNQMRGRGGCYKHTFYGITSYQCMEATPSLACANKCVFCWRHHKNPVGTEWRWKEDDPEQIVSEAISLHRNMINQMKGVPGVVPERLHEAMTVKHCALSLVGEPIMYPRINELLRSLHGRGISSFLVTNAQFPDRIQQLDPVTQLYVSIDAASKESLKAIDRPLFKDYWERYLESLRFMREKQQRTVYRLTLVKSWNMNELDEYCHLIEIGQPDFIEIKAVTYCGKSDASSLTMENVPWHREVCEFSESIAKRLNERGNSVKYSIATEHEHSCCILLAREDKFLIDNIWYTWIDYPRFQQLVQSYYESNKINTFTSTDYMAATPDWAMYKSKTRGFDPKEIRYKKNPTTGETSAVIDAYQPSESGCG